MIAFPKALVAHAERAGMAVPPDPDKFLDYREEFPHFAVFCLLQIGTSMPTSHAPWTNAEVIAAIPVEELKDMTLQDFEARGFAHGASIP